MSPEMGQEEQQQQKKHTVNMLLEGAKRKAEPLEVPRRP